MNLKYRRALWLYALFLLPLMVGGCTVYQVAPDAYTTVPPTSFDRAWSAVLGAFADESVSVTRQDRGAGVVQGTRGGINLTASVRTQADGGVRTEFNTAGATSQDPGLIDRVSHAYQRRMGR
jgi:hypothetical protein